ncbi:MAG: hypothetical protein P1U86_14995 [Verrucomicrobiales bacterium]|nr:hypothetical protein [Verrucomicrobiales bacterium]
MKYRQIFQALGVGYLVAAVFLTVALAILGAPFGREYFLTLVWTGIYGFFIGFLVFAPLFRLIPGHSLFWRYSIAALFGGSIAYGVIYFFLTELAMTIVFGGFAVVMGFFTFLAGSIFHYRESRGGAEQNAEGPQQGGDLKPDNVSS